MSAEPWQSATGHNIDDNYSSSSYALFASNSSPLFYTVNPRSGISLRQQEQLGTPSILKSFRDLPGCTRLSSSLTNLDSSSSSKRAQFPLLPSSLARGSMGRSLQSRESTSKRFVRERYNPPFKVNAKIRHVYTQEVTTIEPNVEPSTERERQQQLESVRHSGHRHSGIRSSFQCHRQTQTESAKPLSPKGEPEVNGGAQAKSAEDEEIVTEQKKLLGNNENSQQNNNEETETERRSNKKDASTSPIPSPFFTYGSGGSGESSSDPFSGCSQTVVYPPLNYVRKLEDLEKITGHIVIQRFFTKTDEAFGTWLERQLGITTKSVSVDTSEIEIVSNNATMAERQGEPEEEEDEKVEMMMQLDSGIETASGDTTDGTVVTEAQDDKLATVEQLKPLETLTKEDTEALLELKKAFDVGAVTPVPLSDAPPTEDAPATPLPLSDALPSVDAPMAAECKLLDAVKCECYLNEIKKEPEQEESEAVKEIEEQIVPETVAVSSETAKLGDVVKVATAVSGAVKLLEVKKAESGEEQIVQKTVAVSEAAQMGDVVKVASAVSEAVKLLEEKKAAVAGLEASKMGDVVKVATAVSGAVKRLGEKKEESEKVIKTNKSEEEIDEMVRCTLEAYLMAPLAFEDIEENASAEEKSKVEDNTEAELESVSAKSPKLVDSGRAESITSQEYSKSFDAAGDTEGNTTSHDSVDTVYEIPIGSPKLEDMMEKGRALSRLQRCLSADSCIGTESSGEPKNAASQSSNDTTEGLEPPNSSSSQVTKLPAIPSAKSVKLVNAKTFHSLSSIRSQKTLSPGSAPPTTNGAGDVGVIGSGRTRGGRINEKTDVDAEDADAESETESEFTDNPFVMTGRSNNKQGDGTDLELEEDDGEEDDRDAFDKMVANHLKYSRGLPSTTNSRRSRLNRGTQTTKSIEPSSTSGSLSPCSSTNSSFDVEIISKSKRITTGSSSGGAGGLDKDHLEMITPSNMTLAWHEGGRRRSYLPNSSSSLNLLNMKFSVGKDFESEVSIRMPSSTPPNKSSIMSGHSTNLGSASMLLPGSGGTGGKTPLMSSGGGSRSHHHHHHSYGPQRGGVFPPFGAPPPQSGNSNNGQSPLTSATTTTMQMISDPKTRSAPNTPTELQSLWKDVRNMLDAQVDELAMTGIPEEEEEEGLKVKGNGIMFADHPPPSSARGSALKLRRNEEKIKRSLQRLKKILDD